MKASSFASYSLYLSLAMWLASFPAAAEALFLDHEIPAVGDLHQREPMPIRGEVPAVPLGTDNDHDLWETPDDCNDGNDQIHPGATEVCNSVDDDCDGQGDEGFPTLGDDCTNGMGACEVAGEIQCDGLNAVACDATPGTPTPEICANGIDENCDGVLDAGTRYVSTTGSDLSNDCTVLVSPCLTIQHAIDQACDGDTVTVSPGNFPENVSIDKPLTLNCANAGIPWDGVRGAETVIDGSGGPVVVDISGSDVTIDGCDILGGGATYAGVQLFNGDSNVEDVTVANNRIHGMSLANPFAGFTEFAYGVFGVTGEAGDREQISGLVVQGNHIHSIGSFPTTAGAGVFLYTVFGASPGDGASITGNRFQLLASVFPSTADLGTGVLVLEGTDDILGVPLTASSGVQVTGNEYVSVVGGAVLFTTASEFDETNSSLSVAGFYLLNIGVSGPGAAVDELALTPFAKTDKPTGFPDSALYTPTIQSAVDASDPTATVSVTPGTFVEQVSVAKTLDLVGSGPGATTIQAPALLLPDGLTGSQKSIVVVNGSSTLVELSLFTIAGPGPAICDSLHYGVFVYNNAIAYIHDNEIRDIRDHEATNTPPISGCQNGVAVRVGHAGFSSAATAVVEANDLHHYQKNGMIISGNGSQADVADNNVFGVGPQTIIAQNGIQVSDGALAIIVGNDVRDHLCDHAVCGPDPLAETFSAAILTVASGDGVVIDHNDVADNDVGIYNWTEGTTTITNNTLVDNRYEGMFLEEGTAQVEDNTVSGGNVGVAGIAYDVAIAPSVATLLRNVVTGAVDGFKVIDENELDADDVLLTATYNHIFGNTTSGFDNTTPVVQSADCNWWGHPSGPGPRGGAGTGDSISLDVDASDWLLAADFGVDTDLDTFTSCTSDSGGDCGPTDDTVYPGATELCDNLDNDCDGVLGGDEIDNDLDTVTECDGDCDDADDLAYPGAFEFCDLVDNNCDGGTDDNGSEADSDCDDSGNICTVNDCIAGSCDFSEASGDCSVTGHVHQNELGTDVADVSRPVPDVTVELTGDATDDDLTDGTGFYELVAAVGDVAIEPSKVVTDIYGPGDDFETGLSSFDATKIARHSVGLEPLTGRSLSVADVSNLNGVNSFDASLVAQKAVDHTIDFPRALVMASDWAFFPASQSFLSISQDETADFAAALWGDVDMSWSPGMPAPPLAPEPEGSSRASGGLIQPQLELRLEAAVLYLAGAPVRNADGSSTFILRLDRADGIQALDMRFHHAPGVISVKGLAKRGLSESYTLTVNTGLPGEARVSLFGIVPMQGGGELLAITAFVEPGSSGFPFRVSTLANEGLVPVDWHGDPQPKPVAKPKPTLKSQLHVD